MDQKRLLKEIRNKYGRIKTIKRDKYHWQRLSGRYAEENIARSLYVLHDTNRDRDWALRIKEKFGFCGAGEGFDL